eukprot:1191030-Prorocentrum_minimum.AAC.1
MAPDTCCRFNSGNEGVCQGSARGLPGVCNTLGNLSQLLGWVREVVLLGVCQRTLWGVPFAYFV